MLTLDDIQNAPTDLTQLSLWAQRNGHIPPAAPAPETPPLVPPATVTKPMSPVTQAEPKSSVATMTPPGARDRELMLGATEHPNLPASTPTPADMTAPEIGGGMPGGITPDLGGASAPAVKPMTPPDIGSSAYTKQELEDLTNKRNNDTLSSHDTLLGKIGHVAGRIGNIAGNAVVPDLMQSIPGTQLNEQARERALKGELATRTAAEGAEEDRKAREKNLESEEALRTAEIEQHKKETEQIGKPAAPKTAEERTFVDLMEGDNGKPRMNPDTNKPFTALEALRSMQKPPLPANAVATPEGITDYQERLKTLGLDSNAEAIYSKVPPGTTAAELEKRYTDAAALKNKNQAEKDLQMKNQQHLDEVAWRHQQTENKEDPAEKAFRTKQADQVVVDNTSARSADFRMRSMEGSYPDALKGDQQAMLNLLTNHIGMTLGLQKGARITKDILHEAQASAPWLETIKAKWGDDGYLSGVVLTKGQMDSMMKLAVQQRHNAWQQVHDSAKQAGLQDKVQFPNDFKPEGETGSSKPPEGKSLVYDPKGNPHFVKSDKLDDFLKDPKYKGWSKSAPANKQQ